MAHGPAQLRAFLQKCLESATTWNICFSLVQRISFGLRTSFGVLQCLSIIESSPSRTSAKWGIVTESHCTTCMACANSRALVGRGIAKRLPVFWFGDPSITGYYPPTGFCLLRIKRTHEYTQSKPLWIICFRKASIISTYRPKLVENKLMGSRISGLILARNSCAVLVQPIGAHNMSLRKESQ